MVQNINIRQKKSEVGLICDPSVLKWYKYKYLEHSNFYLVDIEEWTLGVLCDNIEELLRLYATNAGLK